MAHEIKETIIDRLERIRIDYGYKKNEFSKKLGIDSNYYSQIVMKRRSVSLNVIISAFMEFPIDLNWLILGTEACLKYKEYPTEKDLKEAEFLMRFSDAALNDRPEKALSAEERGLLFFKLYSDLTGSQKRECLRRLNESDDFCTILLNRPFHRSDIDIFFYSKSDDDAELDNITKRFPDIVGSRQPRIKRHKLEAIGCFPSITRFFDKIKKEIP